MSDTSHDVMRGFDELDPDQFGGSESRGAELASELSQVHADDAEVESTAADARRAPTFGDVAAQLPQVEREIAQAESRLASLGESGNSEESERVSSYLASLQNERIEIQQAMENFTTKLDNPVLINDGPQTSGPERSSTNDPYRYAGRPSNEIKRELRKIKGWDGVQTRVNRRHGDSLGGAKKPADILLDGLAHEVKTGMRPVTKAIWSEFYDRYNSDGSIKDASSDKPEKQTAKQQSQGTARQKKHTRQAEDSRRIRGARYFDSNDYDTNEEYERSLPPDEWNRETQRADLPAENQTGYDRQDEQSRSGTMPAQPEQIGDQAINDKFGHELGDDLKQILAENDTEAYYGAPSSPLRAESTGSSSSATRPESPRPPQTNFDTAQQAGEAQLQPMTRVERRESIENDHQFEIGGVTFKNGEMVTYTEADGDKAPHMIIQKVGENPARLRLLNLESGTEFAIDEDSISRIEKLQNDGEAGGNSPEDEDDPIDQEGGELYEKGSYLEKVPKIPSAEEILALAEGARLNVDAQIQAVAQAKEQREKFFGRTKRDQTALEQANASLESAYAQYTDNWAAVLADYRGVEAGINDYKTDMQEKVTVLDESIARLEADTQLPPALRQSRIDRRKERILEAREAMQKCDEQLENLRQGVEEVTRRVEVEMIVEMAQTRSKIEAAQCELKVGTKSEKFRTFWRSKNGRRTRLAVGAALGIAGAAIAMTGVGAGVGSAMVAGAGAVMRGTGGFMATEAGVNMLHNRRANKADLRGRTEAWGAQSASTQLEAGRDMEYISANTEGLGAEKMTEQEIAAFLEANAGALYSERVLRGALAGNPESSAAVADLLLKNQLDRVNSDAKSNRRAKRGAAVVGVAAAAAPFVLRHFFSGPPKGPEAPKPYSPDEARFKGILSTDKNAAQNWEHMTDKYQGLSPAEKAMYEAGNQVYDRNYGSALRGLDLSNAELDRLNFILGRGSVDVGNDQMVQLTRNIAQQVQRGVPTEKILQLYGMPTDGLNGAA